MRVQNSEFRISNGKRSRSASGLAELRPHPAARTRRLSTLDPRPSTRSAFTLVEMLVSVALIVLLMSMFAEIFQLATGAMSAQRGLAENDQRARSLSTILRADLDKRTFRNLVPFFPGEASDTSPTSFSDRRGYFYISENNPDDDTDDVLQFTVDSRIRTANKDETPFYGRTALLAAEDPNNPGTPLAANFLLNWNQPEADDGQTVGDGASLSPCAEISYFLRNGNLYRRVLLIRKPLTLSGADAQPTDKDGKDFFLNANTPNYYFVQRGSATTFPSHAFWYDFDFSAHYFDRDPANPPIGRAIFNGIADLDNGGTGGAFPLAKPFNRFGHNHEYAAANAGQPREYVDDPGPDGILGNADDGPRNSVYIGRFTQQETSFVEDLNGNGSLDPGEDRNQNNNLDDAFGYPHRIRVANTFENPMDRTTGLSLRNGVVADSTGALFNGWRRGEDILMTNVHSFDVKVWDEALGMFVDLGHLIEDRNQNGTLDSGEDINGNGVLDIGIGDYHWSRRLLTTYGPAGPWGNRVFDTWHPSINNDPPPFLPMAYYPSSPPGPVPPPEFRGQWAAQTNYVRGEVVFPATNAVPPLPFVPFGAALAYRCIVAGTSGAIEPNWPGRDRMTVTDDTVVWQAMYNLRPLRAIRITIRFYDVSSGQLRQITLEQSLMD